MQDETDVVDAEAGIAAPVVEYPQDAQPEAEAAPQHVEGEQVVGPAEGDDPLLETTHFGESEDVADPVIEDDGWEDPDPTGADALAAADAPDEPRRPRGWLETDIERLLGAIETGEVPITEGQKLTPHFIAKKLTEVESLAKEPSTGAVSAVFDRWVKIGAANMAEKPYAFLSFTPAARTEGIAALKAQVKEAKKEAAAAAKAAAAPEVVEPAAPEAPPADQV